MRSPVPSRKLGINLASISRGSIWSALWMKVKLESFVVDTEYAGAMVFQTCSSNFDCVVHSYIVAYAAL